MYSAELNKKKGFERRNEPQGPCFKVCNVFPGIGIPIIKIRGSIDHRVFIRGIPIRERWPLETTLRPLAVTSGLQTTGDLSDSTEGQQETVHNSLPSLTCLKPAI